MVPMEYTKKPTHSVKRGKTQTLSFLTYINYTSRQPGSLIWGISPHSFPASKCKRNDIDLEYHDCRNP